MRFLFTCQVFFWDDLFQGSPAHSGTKQSEEEELRSRSHDNDVPSWTAPNGRSIDLTDDQRTGAADTFRDQLGVPSASKICDAGRNRKMIADITTTT